MINRKNAERNDEDNLIIPLEDGQKDLPWTCYKYEKVANVKNIPPYIYNEYHIYIYSTIEEQHLYTDLFQIIRNCSNFDIIHIYINSLGGDLCTLCSFSSVIEETEAYVICHVDGDAFSAAFILAFMGDEVKISKFSQLMAHNSSIGVSSINTAILDKYIQISRYSYRKLLEEYCYKVLTKEEIDAIINNGEELHFSAEECNNRLKKWESEHKEESEDSDENGEIENNV